MSFTFFRLAPLAAAATLMAASAFAQDASTAAPTPSPTPADTAAPATSAAPAAPATTPPPAANPAKPGAIGAPPAGKGQVVFFRPSAFGGMAVWFNVRENGVALGKLTNGVYFVATLDPGPHTFTAATENKDTLKLEVDDGETYYVKGGITMGIMMGEANIAPSDQAAFEKALGHMKLAAPPADAKPAAASK